MKVEEEAVPDCVRQDGVMVQDISELKIADFELSADVRFLDHHFIDPRGRTVRVRSFYRLNPGEIHERNQRKSGVPEPEARQRKSEGRHRHFWEKILLDIELPLPNSGLDPIEPIGGYVRYHPEGAWYGPFEVFRKRAGPEDRVIVHCHVHTEGSAYKPLQTLSSMREHLTKLRRERNDPFGPDWYVGFDGEVLHDENPAQAATWESWQKKRIEFKDPPISDELIKLNVNAFPWYPHSAIRGVSVKPIAAFNAQGPITSLIRIEAGATLPSKRIRDHRVVAVMAGNVTLGDTVMKDRTIAYGSPDDEFAPITANEPSLLWLVRWLWKDKPVADFWLD